MWRWYVNKGIDSLIFWKAIPFDTKHLKAWYLVTPVSRRASLQEQRRLQFRKQKMWSTRGCDYRTVTEKLSQPVLYFYVNVSNLAPRDFVLSSRTRLHGFRCEQIDHRIDHHDILAFIASELHVSHDTFYI